ncbi:MAG TPA: hypothetical protein VGI33_10055 [Paenibacillus sp.]
MGRKLYYDTFTGAVLVDTCDRKGTDDVQSTIEQDFKKYKELNERVPETVGMIQLEYGQYAEEFNQSSGVRVNPETLELEFSYPDPSEPEAPPVFGKPLTEQVKEVEAKNLELETKIEDKDRENKNALFEIYNLLGGE